MAPKVHAANIVMKKKAIAQLEASAATLGE